MARPRRAALPAGGAGPGGGRGPRRGRSGAGGVGGAGSRGCGIGNPAGSDASPRDGGRCSGRGSGAGGRHRGGRGAPWLRPRRGPPHGPRGRTHGGGGGHQRGLRGGPAALLPPGPPQPSPPLPALPQRLLPASARRLPAGAGAGVLPLPGHPPPGHPTCPPALQHLQRAAEHRAVARWAWAAPAQGLHGGVGAGDRLLLPAHRGHRPRLLPRDPGCARPRGHGPGQRGLQKGPVAGALQPPLRAVRLRQLGHLRPGGPVPMTGTPSPGAGGMGRWSISGAAAGNG